MFLQLAVEHYVNPQRDRSSYSILEHSEPQGIYSRHNQCSLCHASVDEYTVSAMPKKYRN
jgi:hypothetical protein